MMQVAFHQIIGVAAVGNRFMSATSLMRVLRVVRTTRVARSTGRRIRTALRKNVFIDVPLMGTVKMPVMQIIDVIFVFDSGVPATGAMRVRVLVVRFVIAHFDYLLPGPMRESLNPIPQSRCVTEECLCFPWRLAATLRHHNRS
jgi:hypothetical protein